MKLINNAKCKITTSKGDFLIGKIMDFEESEAKTLLRYKGIESIKSLETKEKPAKASKSKK